MQLLRLIFYALRLSLFLTLAALFRVYLVLIFLSKPAAPVLLAAAVGGGLWWLPELTAIGWSRTPPAWQQIVPPEAQPWLAIVLAMFATWFSLNILSRLLRPTLGAFPMPSRPLPPLWPRRPREHVIRTVKSRSAVPRLPLRYWGGDVKALERRLAPELQALLSAPAQASGAVSVARAAPTPAAGSAAAAPPPAASAQRAA